MFARRVMAWADDNPRSMPWKETTDPYKIWVSEIILQQTQVSQGLPYYLAFIKRFPTVRQLAMASEDAVLHAWQGLGYNSRARHMHAAAREIVYKYHGVFPNTYVQIRTLKGIGEYTAAAIASFAFGIRTPVLDINVIRVLSRVKGITADPSRRETRAEFFTILEDMISKEDPARFNQAIMNFGALQCTPRKPECTTCVLSRYCVALRDGLVEELPVRKTRITKRVRWFHYFIIHDKQGLILHQRTAKDIWQRMYELPMIETTSQRPPAKAKRKHFLHALGVASREHMKALSRQRQTLAHQEIRAAFYLLSSGKLATKTLPADYRFVTLKKLSTFAFPKVIRTFLADNCLHLFKLPAGVKT
jgi:A/G-specific adenine glycosylase